MILKIQFGRPVLINKNSKKKINQNQLKPLFFETMRVYQFKIPLWHYHAERMNNTLKHTMNERFDANFYESLYELITMQLIEIKLPDSKLKIDFCTDNLSGDIYLILESINLDEEILLPHYQSDIAFLDNRFTLNYSKYSRFKMSGAQPYVEIQNDNSLKNKVLILQNNKGESIETPIGNIFFKIDETWFTPGLESGCVGGVMRKFLMVNQESLNISIKEKTLLQNEIPSVKALFWTNALRGVVPIKQLSGYPEFNDFTSSRKIREKVELIFSKEKRIAV